MSRSFRPSEGVHRRLDDLLLAQLLPPGHIIDSPCWCEKPLSFHGGAILDDWIAPGSLVRALAERGWRLRNARRVVTYERNGFRYGHDNKSYRRNTWRAYRRDAKVKTATGRADEIENFQPTRGWDTW